MVSQHFRRFLSLERPRPAAGNEPAPNATERGRFDNVEAPPPSGARPSPPRPPEVSDRFRAPRERPLEIAERPEDAQPFSRCARCELDNSVYAAACQNCGADLTSAAQRAFNQRLWAQRREEAARERSELAGREQALAEQAAAEKRAQLDLVVEMARREGQRVHRELGDSAWSDQPGASTPWGIRLLGHIANPRLRVGAGVAAVGLPLLLLALGHQGAGLLLLAVLAVLFAPHQRSYRSRRWWWWE